MGPFRRRTLSALVLALSAAPAVADESIEAQLKDLRQRYLREAAALRDLEARLRQLEAQVRGVQEKRPPAQSASAATAAGPAEPAASTEAPNRAAQSKGVEAVLKEEHALFDRRLTVEAGFTYAHSERALLNLSGFLALDSIFLGSINVDKVKADVLTFDLTARYGLSDRLQLDLNAPFLYRRSTYQSGGAGGSAATLSEARVSLNPDLGDISGGVYYQLFRETGNLPDVVWNVRLKAPTGTHPFGINTVVPDPSNNNLVVPARLPSGTGVWSASTGLSFVRTADPAVLFANVAYYYNAKRHFDDINGAAGLQPGEVKLGDSFQYGLGTAIALSERTSLSLSYSQRFTARTRTRPDGANWSSVIGSDGNAAMLNLGLTHALTDRLSMVGSLGAGLTPDAPDIQFSLRFPYTY